MGEQASEAPWGEDPVLNVMGLLPDGHNYPAQTQAKAIDSKCRQNP
ncbi:hypothetical protein GCM10010405_54830 [Streptomyces macrosporus]|uniref:Uncharacterized protein n=1 Tax=Streptomyces macrosporus TaxID=44032 RepID=A0ABN3KK89_9ACTN